MSIRIFSAALSGIEAKLIEVEVDSSPGIHSFNIVGLPDKAVQESKERIGSAIKNSKLSPPKSKTKKVIVNLAPADIKKEGPSYDLPIAIGYLFETGQIKLGPTKRLFAGELSLNGQLKPISGALAIAILAKNLGFSEVIIPSANVIEASIVRGIDIIGADTLLQVIGHTDRTAPIPGYSNPYNFKQNQNMGDSFTSIKGQESAKRALIVAAAGSHNIFMSGPPGSGKTLLAKAITDILPPLSFNEAVEVAKIYSSVGLFQNNSESLSMNRPFRNPHHTTSAVAVIGGGAWPKPGEVSLAHRGILFLDELPEFPRNVLEALRQPLEDGEVTISRAAGSLKLPAKFMLVAAMNPCPCGNYGNPFKECICLPFNLLKYKKRVSGPLLDRIDIRINVPRETISENDDKNNRNKEDLIKIREKILKAKDTQLARFEALGIFSNSEMSFKNVEQLCLAEKSARLLLKKAINKAGQSLRSFHKTLKVARTIADLEGSETVKDHHVAEALSLKMTEDAIAIS